MPLGLSEARWAVQHQDVGFSGDYYVNVWKPGRDALDGKNPYPAPDSPLLQYANLNYPAPMFVALVPLNLTSFRVSRIIWSFAVIAMVVLTLAALGVRDLRLYALWLACAPVVAGLMWGSPTIPMLLASALIWRWRDSPRRAGLTLGIAIAFKLLLAPMILWLLFTRRYLAAAIAATSAIVITLVAWAAISFHGMVDYPELISSSSRLQVPNGMLLVSLVNHLGAGATQSEVVGVIAALALFAGAWRCRTDAALSFALTLIGIQFATPIFHLSNLGFFVVVLALIVPRFTWVWLLLPIMWLTAHISPLYSHSPTAVAALGTAIALTVTLVVLRERGLLHSRKRGEPSPSTTAGLIERR